MYSSNSTEKSDGLIFIHGSQYIAVEISIIIYASGVAAFGISIEIYIVIPLVIINCILVARNCGDSVDTNDAAVWIVKVVCFFVAVELCHRNFRKLADYKENFSSSARAMLRQSLLFSVSMLALGLPGLKALYDGTSKNLPKLCPYNTKHCGIVNLYEPRFSYDNEKCFDDLRDYISAREQLRFLRNFVMLNYVSYSVFNCNFLDIHHSARYLVLRILSIILFISVGSSVLVSYIDPFIYINKCQLPYAIIECILFVIVIGLPTYNLYRLRNSQSSQQQLASMERSPRILPGL